MGQFTCGLCKERLKKPRSLPCLHSFCELCLRAKCGDELFVSSIQCPNCDRTTPVPGGNVSNFPLDFLADRFLSVITEVCPGANANAAADGEADGETPNEDHITAEKNKLFERCYGHEKIKDQFCHGCRVVFCQECAVDHDDHPIGSVQDAAMSAVQNLSALSTNTSERIAPLQESIEEIRSAIGELEDQHQAAESRLISTFDELHAALDHRMNFLREELSDLRSDRVSILKMRRNEFCATIKKSLELKQAVTESLEGDTDTELLKKEEDLGEALYTIINKGMDITNKCDEVEINYEFKAHHFTNCISIIPTIGEIEFHFDGDEDLEREATMERESSMVEREPSTISREPSMVKREQSMVPTPAQIKPLETPAQIKPPKTPAQIRPPKTPSKSIPPEASPQPVTRAVTEADLKVALAAAMKVTPQTEPVIYVDDEIPGPSRAHTNAIIEAPVFREDNLQQMFEAAFNDIDSATKQEQLEAPSTEESKALSSNISREGDLTESMQSSSSRKSKADKPRKAPGKDSNPCYEVHFKAPEKETIARYRDISTNPVIELGGKGHEPGKMYYPYGVAVMKCGSLLVSDQGNSRVQVLDPQGNSVLCFGAEGKTPGNFNGPSGVHCHDGLFYVSDTGNNRVQVFDEKGTFVKCIGEGRVNNPRGLTIHGEKLYVASSGSGRVCLFNLESGEFIGNLRNRSPHNCDLQLPTGVTTCSEGGVFLTDANNFFCNHFIQVLSPEHEYQHSVGIVGNGPGEFLGPSDIAVDELGNVIITDTRNHRIQIIDKNNNLVSCVGLFGRRQGQLHFPYGICERSGVIYVCDTNNHRIQIFNSPANS